MQRCTTAAGSFEQALVTAWAANEALLNTLWQRHVEQQAGSSGVFLNSDRKKKISGKEFTTSVTTEVLALAGVVDQGLYEILAKARRARNNWLHGLEPVGPTAVGSAVVAAERLLGLVTDVHLSISLTQTDSGLSRS